jgi:hypothetical protein
MRIFLDLRAVNADALYDEVLKENVQENQLLSTYSARSLIHAKEIGD